MKIIDLLNKIANGEEVPQKIEYDGIEFIFDKNYRRYVYDDGGTLGEFVALDVCLNAEVEIIEEEPEEKEIKKITSISVPMIMNDREKNIKNITETLETYWFSINKLIDAVNKLRKEK